MNITVVALGKIGLPLAVQFAAARAPGHRCRRERLPGRPGQQRHRAVPRRGPPRRVPGPGGRGEGTQVAAGRLTATTDTTAAVARSEAVVVVVPLFVDDRGQPRLRLDGRGHHGDRSAGCSRARWSATRPRCRSAPPAPGSCPCSRRAAGWWQARTSTWCSARSGCSPAGSSPTCASTPSWSAASTRRAPSAARRSTRRCSPSTSGPTWSRPVPARTGCGTWAAPRPRRWPSSPRPPTAT